MKSVFVKSIFGIGALMVSATMPQYALAVETTNKTAQSSAVATDPKVEEQILAARAADKARQYNKAIQIWTPLANDGLAEAQYRVGLYYAYGHGSCQDVANGLDWLIKAANQGYVKAQTELGNLYSRYAPFNEAPDSNAQALSWYKKAALQGDADAQFFAGLLMIGSKPTHEQYVQAAYWIKASARQDNINAMDKMGDLYSEGAGVAKDYTKAAYWYIKASEKNNGSSQVELGKLYEKGLGVPKDLILAYKWYRLSETNSDSMDSGSDNSQRVAAKMTPSQIKTAEDQISEFNKVYPARDGFVLFAKPVQPNSGCK